MKIYRIISNKDVNYPLTVLVWAVIFVGLYSLLALDGWTSKFPVALALVVSGIFAFGDRQTIPILTRKQLLILGQETGVWLGPGYYFLFWVFSLAEGEVQSDERKDVIVEAFTCQDVNGKVLTGEANGDWANIETPEARRRFELQDESVMRSNLITLLRRTAIRVIGTLVYKTHILGQDLGDRIINEPIFRRECERTYGIVFTNVIADAISANMDQEAINSYYKEILAEERAKYSNGHQFTHAELQEIEANIQVRLGRARRIITNSALLGRYNVDGDSN